MRKLVSVLRYNEVLQFAPFRWLAVIFYLGFLMVTVIIMLNVLIAQMSDTYATVKGNARALATFNRARFLLRYLCIMEQLKSRPIVSTLVSLILLYSCQCIMLS